MNARLPVLAALASLFLATAVAGCGSDSSSVTQVTVTVTEAGVPLPGVPVVESSGVDSSQRPSQPTGVIETLHTDAAGKVTFTVPGSTSTGTLCFSSLISMSGGYSYVDDCRSINALSAAVSLNHL